MVWLASQAPVISAPPLLLPLLCPSHVVWWSRPDGGGQQRKWKRKKRKKKERKQGPLGTGRGSQSAFSLLLPPLSISLLLTSPLLSFPSAQWRRPPNPEPIRPPPVPPTKAAVPRSAKAGRRRKRTFFAKVSPPPSFLVPTTAGRRRRTNIPSLRKGKKKKSRKTGAWPQGRRGEEKGESECFPVRPYRVQGCWGEKGCTRKKKKGPPPPLLGWRGRRSGGWACGAAGADVHVQARTGA